MIFGTFCVAALIHVFFFFQETRAKPLEVMDDIFDNNVFACGTIRAGPAEQSGDLAVEDGGKAEDKGITPAGEAP